MREHLHLLAAIKGVPGRQRGTVVREQLERLELAPQAGKLSGTLSGGNKRRLCVAMATLCEPPIVFLDEPSCGMDPVNARFMWDVIQNIAQRRKRSAVVITTHSMAEAEALSTRLMVMVDGQLKCIGSPQHLKDVYGGGFELTIRMRAPLSDRTEALLGEWGVDAQQLMSKREVEDRFSGWDGYARSALCFLLNEQPLVAAASVAGWVAEEEAAAKLARFMSDNFTGAKVIERQGRTWRFALPHEENKGQRRSLATLFGLVEAGKEAVGIETYALAQVGMGGRRAKGVVWDGA